MRLLVDEKNSEFVCGRPLGLSFDKVGGNLIIIDTSSGFFELNLKSLEKEELVSAEVVIGDRVREKVAKILNKY